MNAVPALADGLGTCFLRENDALAFFETCRVESLDRFTELEASTLSPFSKISTLLHPMANWGGR